jgi:hypothetical protein
MMSRHKGATNMAKQTPTKPSDIKSVFVDIVNSMVSQGAQLLTREEFEDIVNTHDAHGCILMPKDTSAAPENNQDAS